MSRAGIRFYAALALAGLAFALGFGAGAAATPTVHRTTIIECDGQQFWRTVEAERR